MYIFETSIFGIHIAPTWYGLMYAIGFYFCYLFVGRYSVIVKKDMDTLLLYIFLWVIIGGRLWYIILYNPWYFLEHPTEVLALWRGGMSFHGWFLWVLIAVWVFGWRYRYRFFEITDILAVCTPIALWLWRIGNWINGELPWYAWYTGPLAMTLWDVSYFPSPLLQAFLEWVILSIILLTIWWYGKKWLIRISTGTLSAVFLIWYASMRIIAERLRLPDLHIWYLWGTDWITLGIIYSMPMLIMGIILLIYIQISLSESVPLSTRHQ